MSTIQYYQVLLQKQEYAEHHCENIYLLNNPDKLEPFQATLRE